MNGRSGADRAGMEGKKTKELAGAEWRQVGVCMCVKQGLMAGKAREFGEGYELELTQLAD